MRLKRERQYYIKGKEYYNDKHYIECKKMSFNERRKIPLRTDIINFILSQYNQETRYLEIGVRNPEDNFDKIYASMKISVDPGIEFKKNPVDFKMTSDEFFKKIRDGIILDKKIKFDVIFIDGLHLAEQVDRDIKNSLNYLSNDGFIVLHDCNPPTEWHGRYEFNYQLTPAELDWNGTTWKAFMKYRFNQNLYTCCIDSDFGVGIISKCHPVGNHLERTNEFFEIHKLIQNREEMLNLISFTEFKLKLNQNNIVV